jgi:DNA-binding beta-propeller fold protein YncE
MSADPVLQLASGMNVPDDLLYSGADGTVLVGEHGDGHISRVGGANVFERLPQVVGQAEGIARVGDVIYVADQVNNRVVALTATGVQTLIQLQPDPNGLNVDGIASDASGTGLVVPDSPHGTVLFVDISGSITRRVGGFSRPAGVSVEQVPQGAGYLIADENAAAVFELIGGTATRLAGGLPGVDDVVRDAAGHVIVILPARGTLHDVSTGADVAAGLRNPQGLGFDGARNLLVTESDNGRLDLVVTTFAVQVPSGVVQLVPGQSVCFGVLRAPGFTAPVTVQELDGGARWVDPGAGTIGEVVPSPCSSPPCSVKVVVTSPVGIQYAYISYRD